MYYSLLHVYTCTIMSIVVSYFCYNYCLIWYLHHCIITNIFGGKLVFWEGGGEIPGLPPCLNERLQLRSSLCLTLVHTPSPCAGVVPGHKSERISARVSLMKMKMKAEGPQSIPQVRMYADMYFHTYIHTYMYMHTRAEVRYHLLQVIVHCIFCILSWEFWIDCLCVVYLLYTFNFKLHTCTCMYILVHTYIHTYTYIHTCTCTCIQDLRIAIAYHIVHCIFACCYENFVFVLFISIVYFCISTGANRHCCILYLQL